MTMFNPLKPIGRQGSLVFFMVLLFSVQQLKAQIQNTGQIKGFLIDEHKTALPFATVMLKNELDSSLYKSVLSDDKGHFLFDQLKTGQYFLQMGMMSYENLYVRKITINNETIKDVGVLALKPAAILLKAVSVTGKLPFIERRPDKIIINLNDLADGSSMLETMNKLPGVQVSPNDQLSLNGRGVQVYLDGKATTLSADALAGLLKGMSSSGIQKVVLIAQPSAKYDAAGSGGIINIIRKKNYKAGLNGNVYGGLGHWKYNKHNAGLNLNYKAQSFNALLTADYSFNKYYVNSEISTNFFNPEQQAMGSNTSELNSVRSTRNYTPNLGLDFYLSKKTTLSVSLKPGLQFLHKDAASEINTFDASDVRTGFNRFSNLVKTRATNLSSGLRLQHLIDTAGREYTLDFDYFRYGNYGNQDNSNDFYTPSAVFLERYKSILDQDRVFSVYGVKGDYTHPLGKNLQLETGFKSSYVISNNSNLSYDANGIVPVLDGANTDFFKYEENINALYVTLSQNSKKLTWQLGLRGEQTYGKGEQVQNAADFQRNYVQLFPSLHLDYKLSKNHSLSLGANKRIERPGYENLNPLVRILNSTNYLQGNPSLRPAVSYHQVLNFSYKNAFIMALDYSITLRDFTSVTASYDDTGITTTKPDNNRYSQYFGFFMAFNKPVNRWWTTYTNASLVQRTFKSKVNDQVLNNNGRPAFNFSTYNNFAMTSRFSLMFLLNYYGKSEERNIVNDPYFMLTAGAKQVFMGKKASVQLNFVDIFNSYKSRYTQNSVVIKQLYENHYETRTIRLNLSYSFGGTLNRTKNSTSADEERNRTNIKEN